MSRIEKQETLFENNEIDSKNKSDESGCNVKPDISVITRDSSRSRAKNSISSYSNLMVKLDQDLTNQNWFKVDTTKIKQSKPKYNFVDLFSGAGGISKGFVDAGFNKLLSIEINPYASATIRLNFPQSIHIEKPIEEVTEDEIHHALDGQNVDVVCGGPPCNGFSVAGLRDPKDPRNQLFKEFIRVVSYLSPSMVVMENVPGIITMEKGAVCDEIIEQFSGLGYSDMSVRVLEVAQLGVPQLRTRAIFVGNRHGLANPYPRETHARGDYVPIEKEIDDLKNVERNPAINHEWTNHKPEFEKRIAKVLPGGSLYETYRDAFKRQYKGVPSMTIKENHGGVHIHYEKNRVLSAREMARLQTFPDNFIFAGSMKKAYWQIGNAVPCLFAKHLALALRPTLKKIKLI